MPTARPDQRPWIVVEAPARLHLGFVDLDGGLGRRFGSLGLTLDGLATRLRLQASSRTTAQGPQAERAAANLARLREALHAGGDATLIVDEAIPAHAGLGSGTQMALAVGTAASEAWGLGLSPREIAHILDRGARSGIGIGAFELGGFLLDGGRGESDAPPPLISRIPFPGHWRVVLVFDRAARGLHGASEVAAFRDLPPFAPQQAAHLARLVLMQILPALAEADLEPFGRGLSELQRAIGDHFAPAQGGRFTSPRVAAALTVLEARGACCIGQSSWGPTGFAIVDTAERAVEHARELRQRFPDTAQLEFRVVAAGNRGARIRIQETALGMPQGAG